MLIDLIKGNGFTSQKARSGRYPAETIIVADYADDLALLANTPAQAKFLLYSLDQRAWRISFHVDANKTEYSCFKREGPISTLRGKLSKVVDKFTYLESNITSTESDIKIHLAQAWTATIGYGSYRSLIYPKK